MTTRKSTKPAVATSVEVVEANVTPIELSEEFIAGAEHGFAVRNALKSAKSGLLDTTGETVSTIKGFLTGLLMSEPKPAAAPKAPRKLSPELQKLLDAHVGKLSAGN